MKLRITADTAEEAEAAAELLEAIFPALRFGGARQGNNPKYAHDPKFLCYGEPRTKGGQPVPVDIQTVRRRLGLPAQVIELAPVGGAAKQLPAAKAPKGLPPKKPTGTPTRKK